MVEKYIYDVAVIGAGPMGSFVAEQLALGGLKVVILEKDLTPGDTTVCSGAMHIDVVKFIDLPQNVIEKALCNCRLVTNGHIDDWSFPNYIYMLTNRQQVDRFLSKRAQSAGSTLLTQALVTHVNPKQEELFYQNGMTKDLKMIKAKIFIFADGPHSLASKIFHTKSIKTHKFFWIGIEYEIEFNDHPMDRVEIVTNPKTLPFGYYWILPKMSSISIGLGRFNMIDGPPLWDILDEFVQTKQEFKGKRILKRKGGIIPGRINPILQKDNCLIIGDAAGMTNPFTGGGYVCGFLSAKIAAKTCLKAFKKKKFQPKILHSYERTLRRSKYYLGIRLAHYTLCLLLFLYQKTNQSLYPLFIRFYFYVSHTLMRYIKVI